MAWRDALPELFPAARPGHVAAIVQGGDAVLARHDIVHRPLRLQHLLAQIGHETSGLYALEENLSYSAERLCAVWPGRFSDAAAAEPFARAPERLANAVYGGRMGNGDAASGDGWRFRGRGYLQITGRQAYRESGRRAGIDLERAPERAAEPDDALAVACGYWQWRGMNVPSDRDDVVAVSRRLNGGLHGLADRRRWLESVRRALAVAGGPPWPAATVAALQGALREAGYGECGPADGLIGPRTLAAVARLRADRNLVGVGPDDIVLGLLGLSTGAGAKKGARPPGMAGAGPGDLRPGELPQGQTATLSRLNSG